MRKAISVVLAGLLVILPVEQVLAQAVQQEAVSVQQAVASDPAASLFRVPPLTENDVRLLRTSSERALLDPGFSDAPFVQQEADDGLTWEEWAIVLGAVVVVGAVVGGAIAWGENNNPESFKSKHNVFYGIGFGALVALPALAIFGLYAFGR